MESKLNTTDISQKENNNLNNESNILHDKWVLWYHTGVKDWSINSYKQIYEISDVETLWRVINNIYTFTTRSFFIFRKGILPIYEDEQHKNGGALSYKVHKTNADKVWEKMCCLALGETINKIPLNTTGLSISPKLHSVVIKIWVRQKEGSDVNTEDEEILKLNPMYKSHTEKEDFGKYPNNDQKISLQQKYQKNTKNTNENNFRNLDKKTFKIEKFNKKFTNNKKYYKNNDLSNTKSKNNKNEYNISLKPKTSNSLSNNNDKWRRNLNKKENTPKKYNIKPDKWKKKNEK